MFKSVAVFCGSNCGDDPIFVQHARDLGKRIAELNISLVYGGGRTGLMGAIADAVLESGGNVIGVIPEVLKGKERQHEHLSKLHIVLDMHTRKKMMYDLCDAAIILPGGNGTLDEMFEMATWNALSLHNKKIILLNTAGFYNYLIGHINHMQMHGFLHSNWREMIDVYDTPDAIFFGLDEDRNQNHLL